MKARYAFSTAIGLTLLANAGCLPTLGPLDIQHSISRSTGVELKRVSAMTTHGLSNLWLASLTHGVLPMWHVGWVGIGEYDVEPPEALQDEALFADLELPGWDRMTRERDDDGQESWIFVQCDEKSIRAAVAVISREESRLAIVKVTGRLEKFLEHLTSRGYRRPDPNSPAATTCPAAASDENPRVARAKTNQPSPPPD